MIKAKEEDIDGEVKNRLPGDLLLYDICRLYIVIQHVNYDSHSETTVLSIAKHEPQVEIWDSCLTYSDTPLMSGSELIV